MKNLFFSFIFIMILTVAEGQETPKIRWYSIEEAVELNSKSKAKDKKKFFIDVYTDWCGWCKKMDANTFTDPVIVKPSVKISIFEL